jgi:hypothetical protein
MKEERVTKMNAKFLIVVCMGLAAMGCASFQKAVSDRVDPGDGKVLGVVPVDLVSEGADAAAPGSGKIVGRIEEALKARREAKLGPFNGMAFTTRREIILKDGTSITEEKIAKIIETLTPIVPEPVVRVITPAQFVTVPQVEPVSTNEVFDPAFIEAAGGEPATP